MSEVKNVNQRLLLTGAVLLIALVMLWPPKDKLRPGLDIAGGTSLIFEIEAAEGDRSSDLAERVKTQLQKRVDPKGVFGLTWRVQGQNRIEVQMPLPPKEAKDRRKAFADALADLFSLELKRGQIVQAVQQTGAAREAAIQKLAEGHAPAALAALTNDAGGGQRAAIEAVVAQRQELLTKIGAAYDAMMAAEAAQKAGPPATNPAAAAASAPASAPITAETLEEAVRDTQEAYEDAVDALLAKNLNRRRFQEVLELDEKSSVRQNSLKDIRQNHADLGDKLADVLTKHAAFRKDRQYLDGSDDLKRLLRGAGKLEFRILATPSPENQTKYDRYRNQLKQGRLRQPGDAEGWFKIDDPLQFFNLDSPAQLANFKPEEHGRWVIDKLGEDYYVLARTGKEDGLLQGDRAQAPWKLTSARPDHDQHGRWCVSFQLDPMGGKQFYKLTSNNVDRPLCILVDDVAYSAPNIQTAISRSGQITGEFSQQKVQYLVQTMEGGMLPARVKDTPLSERTIGSSLGEANRDNAIRAGLYGAVAVIATMLIYYTFCGAVANVAMLLNVLLTLAALAMLGARFTLDGIAGLILSIGMAVDANVLIYERMREEKERGASLRMIIRNGYDRAFSTIFDSNMTTLLTCVIIYYVGSEEVKGFGLTLGWGVALNLFTAVFVTRTLFDLLLKYNAIKDVKMLKLIGVPNIDWHRLAKFLVPVTVVITLAGVALLVSRGREKTLDIEFLGGIAAEFEAKPAPAGAKALDDIVIARLLSEQAEGLAKDAKRLGEVKVEPVADTAAAFNVSLPGVDAVRLAAMLTEPLEADNVLARGTPQPVAGAPAWQIRVQGEVNAEQLASKIRAWVDPLTLATGELKNATVNAVLEAGGQTQGRLWNVTSTGHNMRLFSYALTSAIGEQMQIDPKIAYVLRGQDGRPYPVTDRLLSAVVPNLPAGANADVTDYLGGAAIYLDQIDPPQAVEAVTTRLNNMLFKPDFADMPRRDFTVLGVNPSGKNDERGLPLYKGIVVVAFDPDVRYGDDKQLWYANFAQGQTKLVEAALSQEQTLRKVMQFKPQIAARATQQAGMSLVLSWAMIVAYLWIRFGKVSFGLGGVVALIHDVLLALAFVGFSGVIASTALGKALLVEDFRINMPIIAALLTIIGYSVNDTIVVFDRIREIRGRLGIVTIETVNDAINQTLSRTLMTVFTVFLVIVIAYIFGGSSIRGFNYCMLIGVLTGCYSSIAIASPLLLFRMGKGNGAQPNSGASR